MRPLTYKELETNFATEAMEMVRDIEKSMLTRIKKTSELFDVTDKDKITLQLNVFMDHFIASTASISSFYLGSSKTHEQLVIQLLRNKFEACRLMDAEREKEAQKKKSRIIHSV